MAGWVERNRAGAGGGGASWDEIGWRKRKEEGMVFKE